jgi:hypothetical protein
MSQVKALEMLVNATRLLASDAEVQAGVFPDFVQVPDELALNFDDAFQLSDQLEASGQLTRQQVEALERIDKLLEEMTGRHETALWTLEALRGSREWQAIRAEARSALGALGVGMGPPSTEGITYIRGGTGR